MGGNPSAHPPPSVGSFLPVNEMDVDELIYSFKPLKLVEMSDSGISTFNSMTP